MSPTSARIKAATTGPTPTMALKPTPLFSTAFVDELGDLVDLGAQAPRRLQPPLRQRTSDRGVGQQQFLSGALAAAVDQVLHLALVARIPADEVVVKPVG